ncbi:hypothetical protein D3C80_1513720 [compost metagenome]
MRDGRRQADARAERGRGADHEFVRIGRLRARRDRGVARSTGTEGDPFAVDVDLLVVDRTGQSTGEIGHVVTDRVIVTTDEAEDLATSIRKQIVDNAEARSNVPIEGCNLATIRREVFPLLSAQTCVDR